MHCDYAQHGTPIRIAFFDDRIDIESPGLLLPGMTVEDMQSGVSRIRNPVIARVFRELRLIEQWGSGVKRIFSEAAELGLPEPQLEEITTGVCMRIFLGQTQEVQMPGDPISTTHQREAESRLESRLAAKVLMLLHIQEAGKAAPC